MGAPAPSQMMAGDRVNLVRTAVARSRLISQAVKVPVGCLAWNGPKVDLRKVPRLAQSDQAQSDQAQSNQGGIANRGKVRRREQRTQVGTMRRTRAQNLGLDLVGMLQHR